MGPVEVKEKPSVLLKVTLEEGEWKKIATELSLKLLKLKGVSGATIGEKGNITLEHDGATPDEAEVKKLVKEAGMKFLSMGDPKAEPEKDAEPQKDLD